MSETDLLEAVKQRVVSTIETLDPAKLDKVDMLLSKYLGRERELFDKLKDQYGSPDPSDPVVNKLLEDLEKTRISADNPFENNPFENAEGGEAEPRTEPEEPKRPAADYYASVTQEPKVERVLSEMEKKKEDESRKQAYVKQAADMKTDVALKAATEKPQNTTAPEVKPMEINANGELIIRTCIWAECRNARKDSYLCHKHVKIPVREDGLFVAVTGWKIEKSQQVNVSYNIMFLVLPGNTKLGQRLVEPLLAKTSLRFSELEDVYKKVKTVHKEKRWDHDLKELPKFADKHEKSQFSKFFGENTVFSDTFLEQRRGEIQQWLTEMLGAVKIPYINDFWNVFGLKYVDAQHLEKAT